MQADKNELPEYTGTLGTAGDQAAPTIDKPVADIRGYLINLQKLRLLLSRLRLHKFLEMLRKKQTQQDFQKHGESQSDTAIFLASSRV